MSGGSKKWLGFRGALLAAGMMLGTTAFATSPASTEDKQKRVEVHKHVEKQKKVEVHKHQPSRWDTREDDRAWNERNARRRYEEKRERLEQRAEERRQRYEERQERLEQRAEERRQRYEEQRRREAERRRQLARQYEEQKRRDYGTGGSGYSHPYGSAKRDGDHKNHQHRSDGSCYVQKYDARRHR